MKKTLVLVIACSLSACTPTTSETQALPQQEVLPPNQAGQDSGLAAGTRLSDGELQSLENFQYQTTLDPVAPFDETGATNLGGLEEIIEIPEGTARAKYEDGLYTLMVEMLRLPPLDDERFFYEGWVVNAAEGSVISTGPAVYSDGIWINSFSSDIDYTDHTRYVLTLEPTGDGVDGQPDPAPADHVLEGTLLEI